MGDQEHAGQVLQVNFNIVITKAVVESSTYFQLVLFSLQAGGGLQAGETRRANAALLDLNWLEDGAVAFKADNGKFVGTKKSGHLFANVDAVEDRSK